MATIQETAPAAGDRRVLDLAVSADRILLTSDRGFRRLLSRRDTPKPPGVILVRLRKAGPEDQVRIVLSVLSSETRFDGFFVVIERDRIRVARL